MILANSRRWLAVLLMVVLGVAALAGVADAASVDGPCTVERCHQAGGDASDDAHTLPHDSCVRDHACAGSLHLGDHAPHLHAAQTATFLFNAPTMAWRRDIGPAARAGRLTGGGVERPPRFSH